MTFSKPFIAALAALPLIAFTPTQADASENNSNARCKTYTKTIYIDGNRTTGHGKACEQRDGTWKIVTLSGKEDFARDIILDRIYDDLYDDGYRVVVYDTQYHEQRYYSPKYKQNFRTVYYAPRDYERYKQGGKSTKQGRYYGR